MSLEERGGMCSRVNQKVRKLMSQEKKEKKCVAHSISMMSLGGKGRLMNQGLEWVLLFMCLSINHKVNESRIKVSRVHASMN
jgi:hypothetical protein